MEEKRFPVDRAEPEGDSAPWHDPQEKPIFAARLTPYRSLGKRGFLILMLFVGLTSFISGMMFLMMGAWPVFGFFGLDALAIYVAFRINYRDARGYEEIAIWPHELQLRQVAPSGKTNTHSFNPFWTRFEVDRHREIGVTRMALISKGREIDVGSFLNPPDRETFAAAFGSALATAKAG